MQRNSVSDIPPRRSALWRGVVGCAVAYALVITAVLSGVLQAEWFAQAAAGLAGAHCITDGRAAAAGTGPAAPAGQLDDGFHCPLCTLATGPAVLPEAPAVAFIVLPQVGVPAGGGRDLIHRPGHPGKLPRGPPPTVAAA
jgi:hypothetical protein